ERFEGIVDELEASPEVSVLVIAGGEKAFCAGADLAMMRDRFASAEGRALMVRDAGRMQAVFGRLERLPLLSIAVLGGAAIGGGCELALACDLRVAADEATVGLSEIRLGLLPGAGGTQRAARICGDAVARRLVLTAELLKGPQAAALGLVHWSLPRQELAGFVDALVERVRAIPGDAMRYNKACIQAALDPRADGFALELEGSARLYESAATQALVQAFLDGAR
ncbi:MAG TPA: enoyl-CoA hydratase/isomerase family protein, partial [Gammaproteobacteria bacterium]